MPVAMDGEQRLLRDVFHLVRARETLPGERLHQGHDLDQERLVGVTIAVLRPPHELRELLIETHHRAYAGGSLVARSYVPSRRKTRCDRG